MNLGGLFRGWGRRPDENNQAAAQPRPKAAPAAPAPVSPPPAYSPEEPVSSPDGSSPAQLGSEVEMPLLPILEKLPQDLRAKMTMRIEDFGDASIAIATDQILPQLALGSVKITFGQ